MILRILFLGYALLSTACTSMVMGGGQSSGAYQQQDDRTLQQISEDAEITQRVQRTLGNHTQIDVYTSNGSVTLQGTVVSQREVQRIISQVYRIDGVKHVESQLVVSSA